MVSKILDYQKVEELMTEKGVKSADVAKETGVGADTLSRWKNGEYEPKLDKLIKISTYFGVPIEHFFKDEVEK